MGAAVRALTRNPDSAGLPAGVDVVPADLSIPGTLDAGLDGVEAVFLVWPFLTAEAAPAVLDAVAKHARRIVYLSSSGIHDDVEQQTNMITQFHAAVERLIERSGLEWTFLRPSGFAANTLAWAPQIRVDGVVRWVYGAAARSLIHERDIAAVAVRALTGDGHGGAKYVLTGPQPLTQAEQVRTIGEAIGRPLRWEEISREAAREQMLTYWPPALVDGALDAWAELVTEPELVTPTVEEVTGVPARTFREWATDHADDFR
ncbi:MAG: NAD(P)H-binding protein [Egibacteraceae bacterium]